jgi:hypothetical protein
LLEMFEDIRLFHVVIAEDAQQTQQEFTSAPLAGPSSVCRTLLPIVQLGYKDVTYFGCEGSFSGDPHFYRKESKPLQMVVRAGGREYITTPDYYITTQFLVRILTEYQRIKERSGGLLRAMLEYPNEWEVVALSEDLARMVDPTVIREDNRFAAAV